MRRVKINESHVDVVSSSHLDFMSMPFSPGPGLSSPDGLRLAQKLLRPQLPHDLHDYILTTAGFQWNQPAPCRILKYPINCWIAGWQP